VLVAGLSVEPSAATLAAAAGAEAPTAVERLGV
jgi:hypothetical protein